jgi:GTPase SAR1 family protein
MGAAIARDAPPVVQTLVSALLRTKIEVALAGLDASGKTTLAAALRAPTEPPDPTAPTIGLVVQRARHRGMDLLVWDLGGHHRFRDDWARHVRGCGALLFIVDVSDTSRYAEARQALARLLEDPIIGDMPLLVLANKADLLPPADRAGEELRGWPTLVRELNLDSGTDADGRHVRWSVLGVSATRRSNLDKVLRWLLLQAHGAGDERSGLDGADADERSGRGRLWRMWESLGAWRRRKQRAWGGSRAGFSLLATSLIGAEA